MVRVEVVTSLPAKVGVCRACDVADLLKIRLREDAWDVDISALLQALEDVDEPIQFTNPFTLRGLYLMLRHGTGRLPLVVVDGKLIHAGPVDNPRELAEKIRQALSGAGRSRRSPPRL